MDTFASIVAKYFDEIAHSHSMHRAEETAYHVRYENDRVSFGVSWNNGRSYELGVGIRLKSASHTDVLSFDLWDIVRSQGAPEANWVGRLAVDPGQDLEEPIRKLADLTKGYGHLFLQGELSAFRSVATFTRRTSAIAILDARDR